MWEGYYLLKVQCHPKGYTSTLISQFWKAQHYLCILTTLQTLYKHEEGHKVFKQDLQLAEVTAVRNLAPSMFLRNFAVQTQTSADDLISQLQAIFQFFSSFLPSGEFCQVSELNIQANNHFVPEC